MTKTYEDFHLTPAAENDLEEIWDYGVDKWSIEIAESYYDRLLSGLDALIAGLKASQNVGFLRTGYFRIKVGVHHIYFKENGNVVEVIRILHERMNPELHL